MKRNPRLSILSSSIRTDPRALQILAGLAQVAVAHPGEIEIIISENSGDPQKRGFLEFQQQIAGDALAIHYQNPPKPVHDDFRFLFEVSDAEFITFCADDDFVSYDYLIGAWRALEANAEAAGATGAYLIHFPPNQYIYHDSGREALLDRSVTRRILGYWTRWGGHNALLAGGVLRRRTLGPAFDYLRGHPLEGVFVDFYFSYSALAQGVALHVDIPFLFYEHGRSYYDGALACQRHLQRKGLPGEIAHVHNLHRAVDTVVFLLGRYSPIADRQEAWNCAQELFRMHMETFRGPLIKGGLESSWLPEALRPIIGTLLNQDPLGFDVALRALLQVVDIYDRDLAEKYRSFVSDVLGGNVPEFVDLN